MNIIEIVGIDDKKAKLLKKEGISTIEDLLPLTAYEIKKLAKNTGISAKALDTWQEHADLMRIEGVSPEYAYALNEVGIDSVKELARRNPKNTSDRIKELEKAKRGIIGKLPTQANLKKWIDQAKKMGGKEPLPKKKPQKKKPAKKKPVKKKPAKRKPSKEPEGDYGPEYWNDKYPKAPIIYTGRALRGKDYYKQIDADVKIFIKNNDAILFHVIDQAHLKKDTFNETALTVQDFVNGFFKYKYDEETADCPEFWQFPFESIQSGIGDCEYRLHFASIAKMELF